jgi:hypothetical protein
MTKNSFFPAIYAVKKGDYDRWINPGMPAESQIRPGWGASVNQGGMKACNP